MEIRDIKMPDSSLPTHQCISKRLYFSTFSPSVLKLCLQFWTWSFTLAKLQCLGGDKFGVKEVFLFTCFCICFCVCGGVGGADTIALSSNFSFCQLRLGGANGSCVSGTSLTSSL